MEPGADVTGAYRFVVKEAAGVICVVLEPAGVELPVLEGGAIGLDLRPGTTRLEAEDITSTLNRLVHGVTYRAA